MDARVECVDGPCGQVTALIVNPVTRKVTHFAVRGRYSQDFLVPVAQVESTGRDLIRLRCISDELNRMELFVETHYVASEPSEPESLGYSSMLNAPFVTPMAGYDLGDAVERVPLGELAVRRGTRVDALDGHVGVVSELVVDKDGEYVTHIVLKEGHLRAKERTTLPVSAIDRVQGDTVYLKLDKESIRALPSVPIKQHYG